MNFDLRVFLTKNNITIQLAYGIILIIFIPLLIVFNVYTINNYSKTNLNVALQRQVLVVSRSIYALIRDDLKNVDKLQLEISQVAARNPDFLDLSVLVPEDDDFKVVVSSNREKVGKIVKFDYYGLAWAQDDDRGVATDSLVLAKTNDPQFIEEGFSIKDRFWQLAMPMRDTDGKKQALLTIRISSKIVDDMASDNYRISMYLLAATVLIVILFLSASARFWDYALLYKKIKEVDQMKDEFISMASHELRTPLTAIKGYLSLILDGTYGKIENAKAISALNNVSVSVDRLGALIEDLLNVSRIEQGRIEIESKNVDVVPIIKEIVEQLKVSADQKGLVFEYIEPKEKLSDVWVDPDRLKQVLVNLIGNSIKYTKKGSVKVTSIVNKGKVEIKIADTGIGMSAEEQKHLFEKFYRIKNEETKAITGTGLGLWITKQIIELMKGKMLLESMKDVGTQITVIFTLAEKKK